jgi:cytochrome b subunit of formate dehydrogenase
MNRRDVLIITGVLIWGLYLWLVLPATSSNVSAEIIVNFAVSMIALLIYMIVLIILSIAIKKFGRCGDKKIWKSHKK